MDHGQRSILGYEVRGAFGRTFSCQFELCRGVTRGPRIVGVSGAKDVRGDISLIVRSVEAGRGLWRMGMIVLGGALSVAMVVLACGRRVRVHEYLRGMAPFTGGMFIISSPSASEAMRVYQRFRGIRMIMRGCPNGRTRRFG